jgi:hypothetical protein
MRHEPDFMGFVAIPATLLMYALAVGLGKAIDWLLEVAF